METDKSISETQRHYWGKHLVFLWGTLNKSFWTTSRIGIGIVWFITVFLKAKPED